jgi:hypothetical protein
MTYEPSYPDSTDGSVSKNVLIENNIMEAPTDNGGGGGGANTLTIRYDNVQGNCLRNWVIRNNTITGTVALSSDTPSAGGCDSNFNVIGNYMESFAESTGSPIYCGTGVLTNPIVFRYNAFLNTSCDSTDVNLHNGSFGFVNESGGDYHLTAGSPGVDRIPASAYSVPGAFAVTPPGPDSPTAPLPTDFAGASRPQGSGYDIGAYER